MPTKQCPKCGKIKNFDKKRWKRISLYGVVCALCAAGGAKRSTTRQTRTRAPVGRRRSKATKQPLDVSCPLDAPRIGGETEIAGTLVKILKRGRRSWAKAKLDYDYTIAVTHPRYRQLEVVELMELACDQVGKVEENASLIEYKSGAIAATSQEVFKGLKRAEALLWATLSGASTLQTDGPPRYVNWEAVLAAYNAKLSSPGDLLPFKLYTVPQLLDVLNKALTAATAESPEAILTKQWIDECTDSNPVPAGYEWYYKKVKIKPEAGTAQANFELDLEAIGRIAGAGTDMSAAFHDAGHAKRFTEARRVANELVADRLPGVSGSQKRRLISVLTIFGYTCMVALTRNYFPEKDSFDLIFKSAPDDILRLCVSALAQRKLAALMRGVRLVRAGQLPNRKKKTKGRTPVLGAATAAMNALAQALLDGYEASGQLVSKVSASAHLGWLKYWIFDVFTPQPGGRYGNETATSYGDRIRDESCGPFSWTGKPLTPRIVGPRIFVVTEARRDQHKFSTLLQLRQTPKTTTGSEARELRRLQALSGH